MAMRRTNHALPLYLAHGIPPYSANGNTIVSNYTGTRLQKINNGTVGQVPQPGDVLSYNATKSNSAGHTSIVTFSKVVSTTGNGYINVLEQNGTKTGKNTIQGYNWVVTPKWTTVSMWLHDPLVLTAGIQASSSITVGETLTASYTIANTGNVPFAISALQLMMLAPNGQATQIGIDKSITSIPARQQVMFTASIPQFLSNCASCAAGTYTIYPSILLPDDPSANYTSTLFTMSSARSQIHLMVHRFTVVPDPGLSGYSRLFGTAVLSIHDVWAVGYASDGGQTLVENWNGTAWSVIPSPNVPNATSNTLSSVSAISASNVWAVGIYGMGPPQETLYPLIEQWNGKKWGIISSPTINVANTALYGVKAISATNIWVVGYSYNNGHSDTLIIHWDGTNWNVIPSPNGNPNWNNMLYSIAATSASDIWAVGNYYSQQGDVPLIEHYNGNLWSIVPAQTPPSSIGCACYAVTATSPTDAWAILSGYVEHWNGTLWSIAFFPPGVSGSIDFDGVAAISSNDVWVVGSGGSGIEHWDGVQWSAIPTDPTAVVSFSGVGALTSSSVWVVGSVIEYNG